MLIVLAIVVKGSLLHLKHSQNRNFVFASSQLGFAEFVTALFASGGGR
jgi:hypothetical protein